MKVVCMGLQVMNLIGDVKGKVAVMVDDMIDTAGMDWRWIIFIKRLKYPPYIYIYILIDSIPSKKKKTKQTL